MYRYVAYRSRIPSRGGAPCSTAHRPVPTRLQCRCSIRARSCLTRPFRARNEPKTSRSTPPMSTATTARTPSNTPECGSPAHSSSPLRATSRYPHGEQAVAENKSTIPTRTRSAPIAGIVTIVAIRESVWSRACSSMSRNSRRGRTRGTPEGVPRCRLSRGTPHSPVLKVVRLGFGLCGCIAP